MDHDQDPVLDNVSRCVSRCLETQTAANVMLTPQRKAELCSSIERLLDSLLAGRSGWPESAIVDGVILESVRVTPDRTVRMAGYAIWYEDESWWCDPLIASVALSSDPSSIRSFRLQFGDSARGLRVARYQDWPGDFSWKRSMRWIFDLSMRQHRNTARLKPVGHDIQTGRDLYVMDLNSINHARNALRPMTAPFSCLVLWHAANEHADDIGVLAQSVLHAGATYICCWGTNCSRVHDIFDETHVWRTLDCPEPTTIVTTWHENDSLAEVISFALNTAQSADTTLSTPLVALCVKAHDLVTEVKRAFGDLEGFRRSLAPGP